MERLAEVFGGIKEDFGDLQVQVDFVTTAANDCESFRDPDVNNPPGTAAIHLRVRAGSFLYMIYQSRRLPLAAAAAPIYKGSRVILEAPDTGDRDLTFMIGDGQVRIRVTCSCFYEVKKTSFRMSKNGVFVPNPILGQGQERQEGQPQLGHQYIRFGVTEPAELAMQKMIDERVVREPLVNERMVLSIFNVESSTETEIDAGRLLGGYWKELASGQSVVYVNFITMP